MDEENCTFSSRETKLPRRTQTDFAIGLARTRNYNQRLLREALEIEKLQ